MVSGSVMTADCSNIQGQKLIGGVVRRNVNLSVEVGILVFGGSTKTTRKL